MMMVPTSTTLPTTTLLATVVMLLGMGAAMVVSRGTQLCCTVLKWKEPLSVLGDPLSIIIKRGLLTPPPPPRPRNLYPLHLTPLPFFSISFLLR